MNDFTNQVSAFVRSTILPPIIKHLKDKNIDVTIEELVDALNLPAGSTQIPPFPSTFTGLQAVATGRSARGKKIPADCPKCEYELTRGDNPGSLCGKPGDVTPLGPRCKQHVGKRGGKTQRVEKPSPVNSGLIEPEKPKSEELSVMRIPGTDLYKEVSTGIIFKQVKGATYAVGIEDNGDIRPLNERETEIIKERKINVGSLSEPTQPTLPEIPAL
jgi:hypothetical protein